MPSISKTGCVFTLIFIIMFFFNRILLPFGDEPDFAHRANLLLYGDHAWWSPYSIFRNIIKNININYNCNVDAGTFSFWAKIDANSCTENIENILIRLVLTIFITFPLWIIIVYPKILDYIFNILSKEIISSDCIETVKVMSICLVSPGVLFYIGVLAVEQLVLVLSLFSFFVWKIKSLIFLLSILIFSLDYGNSIIFIFFYGMLYTLKFKIIEKMIYQKKILFLFFSLFISSIVIFGYQNILSWINYISIFSIFEEKLNAINNAYEISILLEKYPIYLRPIITYMSSILTLPSGIKNIPAIFISASFFFPLIIINLFNNKDRDNLIFLYSSITVILVFVFLFPTYSNAKYYIWLTPFILKPLIYNMDYIKVSLFIVSLSLSNIILLFLYRL